VNPPVTATCIAITALQGAAIAPVKMTAAGGTGPGYTFSATGLPAGLSMAADGTISGTATASGTFNYTVTVTDSAGNKATTTCSVTVNPPVMATCAAITAIQGAAITPVKMTASGGAGAYTFSATGLPAGLLMATDGTISGTPAVSGAFNYTVTVADSAGNKATINCSVTVNPPVTATCLAITVIQGAAIVPVKMTASGGTGSGYTFSATGLPAGLSMGTDGIISGTPTLSGTFAYTVTVTDSKGNKGTSSCSVAVTPAPICAPTTFDLTGGNSPTNGPTGNVRTFTAPNGVSAKVSGWSRDKSTGAWAAAWLGSYAPGLGVTDTSEDGTDPSHRVDNVGSRVNYVLFEFSSPVIVNRAYLAAVGADSDITVWIGTASDPFNHHLTLNDAVLAGFGAPEQNSTDSNAERWADINGGNVAGNVLVIAASTTDFTKYDEFKIAKIETQCNTTPGTPTASCVVVNAAQGMAITPVSMAGSGGAGGPYTFTATGLPPGLTMSSAGTISGTPSVTGTFSYTVTVKDKNGIAGTVKCSITVSAAPVCAATTFDLTGSSATTGTPGNIRTFTASNGVKVKASAWGRNKATGAWSPAFLGSYPAGLGVTDTSEDGSDPTHRVDNVGSQLNYVMFEFSQPVVLNRAYLDAVLNDSDISVWIGTKSSPFTNHITLNDSTLASLGSYEENRTTSALARWADVNGASLSGNVIVIAALVSDDSPEDYFKITKLETSCATTSKPISVGDFTTYTQGGWCSKPAGNNPGALLQNNFPLVYPGGSVAIGGTYKLTFHSPLTIGFFLPAGGSPGKLFSSAIDPLFSTVGVIGGQLLALQLNVDFSMRGVTPYGLGNLHVVSGPMAGKTVSEVLSIANSVVGGGSLPAGLNIMDISNTLDAINSNFDSGNCNGGYLKR
jgi:hypothetical protein